MGLQNQPQSLRKPTNFPNLELLSDYKQRPFDRNVINSMNRSHMDNIYPSFANKNSSQRGVRIAYLFVNFNSLKEPDAIVRLTLLTANPS